MGEYKKYYKTINTNLSLSHDGKSLKYDLTIPLPIEQKKLDENHEKLIKNALIIQQRQFNRIKDLSPRTRAIITKHNEILRKKSFDKVIDIFKLIVFID